MYKQTAIPKTPLFKNIKTGNVETLAFDKQPKMPQKMLKKLFPCYDCLASKYHPIFRMLN